MADSKKICISCEKSLALSYFYKSYNKFDSDGRLSVCKNCLKNSINYDDLNTAKDILMQINRPFIHSLWISSEEEAKLKNHDLFGIYMKTLGLPKYRELTWKDSDQTVSNVELKNRNNEESNDNELNTFEVEMQDNNRKDVIKMVGYDPFEFENEQDKRHLYNKLVDFLDESTLEDGFKLPTVIEIVKTFNQLDKINNTISSMTSDVKMLTDNAGIIKSLIDAKDKMYKSVLALAKDNGISVNHNNNKSKGAGTLTGIIKQLQEKGFEESDVNIFDIETSEGMRQVANISNESIFKQLQFDENDYTAMIMEQRELICELESKTFKLEEDNRIMRKQLLSYSNQGVPQ
ncbi:MULTISPECIES: hypothetical protein [Paenibacillus]|uniref:DUF4428 domain-containing protein n=1 Tax=Paenibacillus peoriae TaxID=59893 RepID=A0ABU1QJF4_9BACL|nr:MULTISPECIES: hypothetical protein [Paenibacillus]MDR6779355.1 hypothetical protein [Paenibacillus peoriae]